MPPRGMRSPQASRLLFTTVFLAASFVGLASSRAAGGGRERYRNDEPGQDEGDTAPRFRPLVVSVDVVLGFGRSPVVQAAQPVGAIIVPRTVLDERQVFVESWLFGLRYDLGRGFGAALRVPFSYMSFSSDTFRIATSALGNVELEPSHRHLLDEHTSILFAVGLSAPTGQGVAPSTDPAAKLDQNDSNRFFVQHAASATRGLEHDAWFAHAMYGVSPRVAIDLHPFAAPVTITPYTTFELLVAKNDQAAKKLASDGVIGVTGAYAFSDVASVSLRAFSVIPLAGRDDRRVAIVVAPDVRAEGNRFLGALGLIVPLVGPTTAPRYTGIHAMIGAKF
jgi:hypothetical protein